MLRHLSLLMSQLVCVAFAILFWSLDFFMYVNFCVNKMRSIAVFLENIFPVVWSVSGCPQGLKCLEAGSWKAAGLRGAIVGLLLGGGSALRGDSWGL